MDSGKALKALKKRRDYYVWRRDNRSALEEDTLTEWEKYNFAAEAVEVTALELGLRLPERDSDTRPKDGDAKQGSTCE